jgi:hypothetical protein
LQLRKPKQEPIQQKRVKRVVSRSRFVSALRDEVYATLRESDIIKNNISKVDIYDYNLSLSRMFYLHFYFTFKRKVPTYECEVSLAYEAIDDFIDTEGPVSVFIDGIVKDIGDKIQNHRGVIIIKKQSEPVRRVRLRGLKYNILYME